MKLRSIPLPFLLALLLLPLAANAQGALDVVRELARNGMTPPSVSLPAEGRIEVAFSPAGQPTTAIVRAIGEAREGILVAAYSFTSPPIAQALTQAHARGVRVFVVIDESQVKERYSVATFLANHGVPVKVDFEHAIMHNKTMVLDGRTVVTGSFNFTRSAEERNAENVLIVRDAPRLAAVYTRDWESHWQHARPYSREAP